MTDRPTSQPSPALFWVVTALSMVGLWIAFDALKDFVAAGFRRMSVTEIAVTAFGHGTTILWFFWFVAGQLSGERKRGWPSLSFWTVIATALAIALDLGANLFAIMHERDQFAGAIKAEATITGIQVDRQGGYRVSCEYATQSGRKTQTIFVVSGTNFCPRLQQRLKTEFSPGNSPPTAPMLEIRYDREVPPRAWLEESGGIYQDSLAAVLLVTGIAQGASVAVVAAIIAKLRILKSQGQPVPWWSELYKLAPLACQLPMLLLVVLGPKLGTTWRWIYGGPAV